ncbi:MAG: gliding motility-associated C-terminal domain-containing protein [Bacteroidales bacterium]|nr:gliding motility-associated C-terminal domain-containing protein [Bacteroidales bacterium]
MRTRVIHTILLLSILMGFVVNPNKRGYCEGTKQMMPTYNNFKTGGLYISNTSGAYPKFGVVGCPPNYRLNIHIKNVGEEILFGLYPAYSYYPPSHFNLRKPDGTIALTGVIPSMGDVGYIQFYSQAITGPFPTMGGYTPFQYKVTNIADTGNYYFEMADLLPGGAIQFDLWDFQVVSGEHTPAVPSDMINGRVWSQSWQVYSLLSSSNYYKFNGSFFVYSNDGIVTKLQFQDARIGAATIFCNPYGCYNTGNFLLDRRSVNTNTFITFPEIADYKVFLNDPDSTLYPSGEFGEIVGTPSMIPDPAYPPCSSPKLILVNVTKAGNLDLEITFPYGIPATTVNLFAPVVPGMNQIPWNGLDGLGNPIPDGTPLTVTITFADGLTNLPIWDQETNPAGFLISLVRPVNLSVQTPATFWDDSLLVAVTGSCPVSPQSTYLEGCTPGSIPAYTGCHPWGLNEPDCHDKMINTWWYGSSSTISFTEIFQGEIANAVGHGDSRCGPGTLFLHATVPPTSTVDWYDSLTGGTLLHAGDTSFLTPPITSTTTFYAEARSLMTTCISQNRVPATATILPAPIPTIQGPDSVCAGTTGNLYQTEPGKSNYEWWLSSGGMITSTTGSSIITVTWTTPGHHTVYVNYTDPNGCPAADPAAFRVVVAAAPDSAGPITGPTPVCAESEGLIFTVDTIPWAQSYIWTLPPGFSITSGAGTNTITVNLFPTAASGEIFVYGTNLCGDGSPSPPFYVAVTQPPVAEAGPNDTVCQGSPYTVAGAAALNYSSLLWTTSGTGSLGNITSLSPTYIPEETETGIVALTLIAENPPCLPDTSTMTLRIEPAASAGAGPDLSTCYLSPVSLAGANALNYRSLQWSTSGTGTFDNPTLLHPSYIPSNEDLIAGMVTLTLSVNAMMPCPDITDQLVLTFSSAPDGEAGPDGTLCQGETFPVTGAFADNYSALLWEHSGAGILEESTTLNPIYNPASGESGTVILSLTIWGEGACSDSMVTVQMQLHIYALEVDAGEDQSVDSGAVVFLEGYANEGSGDYQVQWEPALLVTDPYHLGTETLPLGFSGWFILSVTDMLSGCSRSDSLWIEVQKPVPPPPPPDCLEIYNVITPNGDRVNDTWIITCIEQHPDNSVQIVNRWGDRIRSFERYDNVDQVWDGTNHRGEPVPDGTYYYVLTIKDMEPKTGWIFVRGGSR